MSKIFKVFLLILTLTLPACGALTNKNRVYKTVFKDKYGENVSIYRECNPSHLLNLDPYCYKEVIRPQYCYYSLGEINCYDKPLGAQEEARRVK